jgi:hypothetical protein
MKKVLEVLVTVGRCVSNKERLRNLEEEMSK